MPYLAPHPKPAPPPPGGIITDGLIHRWEMQEGSGTTVADEISAVDGTLQGGANWVTGRLGTDHAVNFPAAVDRIEHAKQTIPAPRSHCMWVEFPVASNGVMQGNGGGHYVFYKASAQLYHSAGAGNTVINYTAPVAVWFNLILTVAASGLTKYYENGIQVGGDQNAAYSDLMLDTIGAYTGGGTGISMNIQDNRIYDRVLSDAECLLIGTGNG